MEPSGRYTSIVVGPAIHAWGPFRVRAQTVVRADGRRHPLTDLVVSIVLGPDDELSFARLARSEDSIAGLAHVLRQRLRDYGRDIDYWEEHLRELQRPNRMAALQAQLNAEAEYYEPDAQPAGEEALTATQVLENQRDELRRIRYLYEAIQAGLRELETQFPEIGTTS